MKKLNALSFWLILIGLVLPIRETISQEHIKPPVKLVRYEVVPVQSEAQVIEIRVIVEASVSGNVEVGLHLPPDISMISGSSRDNVGGRSKGSSIVRTWQLSIPEKGYFLVEVGIAVSPDDSEERDNFGTYHSIPIYMEISRGEVVKHGLSQDPRFTQPVVEDERERQEDKPRAQPLPFDTTGRSTPLPQQSGVTGASSTYYITVQMSGRIRFNDDLDLIKGVPNVAVYLDWDYDNNPNTGYTPYYGGNTQHIDYDITDNNGYYYFSFTFQAPQPANYYSPRIRVYANNVNSAAFDGDLGNGAKFGVYYNLDISGATTSVYSNAAHIDVDALQGGALRYLYRARVFSINSLGFTPHTIRYYIRTGAESSFFCYDGDCGEGINVNVPYILLNRIPDSELGYHEYGHFIEYDKVGVQVYENFPGGHWFRRQTTDDIAWTEGWAEFYAAATHMHWYSIELPSQLEYGIGDFEAPHPRVYQFMDYSQSTLFTDRDNTAVEGAVACFLYSLWDNVLLRAPGYSGDNDDIAYYGGFILDRVMYRWNITGSLIGATHIEAYKNSLLNALDTQNDASTNALYNTLILRNGTARPATPTFIQVGGNSISRTVSWNDNTCPSTVTFSVEGWGNQTFDLYENNEQGFRIYRKATNDSWDGTLNGYSLVATVGANSTGWTDNAYLTGRQSYVVVAYNSGGNSLPKAEFAAIFTPPLSVTMSGPTSISHPQKPNVNQYTWTANVTGGTQPYTYVWKKNGYTVGSNSSTYTEYLSYDGNSCSSSQWTLRVDVTGGGSAFATKNVTEYHSCEEGGGGPIDPRIVENAQSVIPESFGLSQNYPNPFNPETEITYALPEPSIVRLTVLDILGREVAVLEAGHIPAGYRSAHWNGRNSHNEPVSSGMYFYRLSAVGESGKSFVETKKMIITK